MAKRIRVSGYDNLRTTLSAISPSKQINILFTGTKNIFGVSWCRLCLFAEPLVLYAVRKFAQKESVLIVVDVGDRQVWRDSKNPFRTDRDIYISALPTLIRWKGAPRLEGAQCLQSDLLKLFLTN